MAKYNTVKEGDFVELPDGVVGEVIRTFKKEDFILDDGLSLMVMAEGKEGVFMESQVKVMHTVSV